MTGRAPLRIRHRGRLRMAAAVAMAAMLLFGAGSFADDTVMDAEIDYLLDAVADSGCTFIRNSSEHEAAAAKEHLQTKRRRGRRYYDSADQFIDRIASRSSMSGKDYRIRCDGEEQTAKKWFTARLERFRAGERRAAE